MEQLFRIDVEALAFSLGIRFEEGMMPGPMPPGGLPGDLPEQPPLPADKPPKKFQIWDGEILQKTLDAIKNMDFHGKDLLLEGQVPSWVIAAIADAYPHLRVYNYVYYLEQVVEMPRLSVGDESGAGEIGYHVTCDGDKVFLQYTADKPGSHEHSYDHTKLALSRVPAIAPGKHIYIAGHGATFVQVAIALAYTRDAKSVSLAFHGGDGTPGTQGSYHCAVTHCDEVVLGQQLDVVIPG